MICKRLLIALVACLSLMATLAFLHTGTSTLQSAEKKPEVKIADADSRTFESVIKPFLDTHCTSCHGSTKSKGDVTLHNISAKLAIGKDLELWNLVFKQLVLSEMPPSKEKQPSASDVSKVIDWINAELNKSGNATSLYQKLEHPDYGNLVNHEKLFSGEIKTKPFPRLAYGEQVQMCLIILSPTTVAMREVSGNHSLWKTGKVLKNMQTSCLRIRPWSMSCL